MKEQATIEQMNEAIALFDGYTIYDEGMTRCVINAAKLGFPVADLRYHESWSWLMPVIKKIGNFLQYDLKKRPPHTATNGDWIEVDIHLALREVDIEKTHQYVYQFIEWYNHYQSIQPPQVNK